MLADSDKETKRPKTSMFQKILIANRGEIACRIMASARRMGIRTVAVYSTADRDSLHVRMADEAICIGPPPAAESYLHIERIIAACVETRSEAVHPGYGFLSENAQFSRQLATSGIVFIGPPPEAIAQMGDKITSKQLARQAGVSTIPGSLELIRDPDHAVAVAHSLGYPVLLKATAGGGGKGMRVAFNDIDCAQGFQHASREAQASFADGRIFLEKYIEQPRHIEIQVLADAHGNFLHLGERECSLQRRHQKVIEECPSPFVHDALRDAMGQQAIALARAVHYQSAGTVEFVVDPHQHFYFLEMNTRLQVEHPVTEMVTGLDLVELMLRIAAGEPLPISQDEVRFTGWATEARVYAEDPARGFLPSVGRIVRYQPPPESPSLRLDSGITEGSEVSIYYDPLLAKLVAHGIDRAESQRALRHALDAFYIQGISHNLGFLAALIDLPQFRQGNVHTSLIAEAYPRGYEAPPLNFAEVPWLLALAAVAHHRAAEREAGISGQLPGREMRVPDEWLVRFGNTADTLRLRADGSEYDVEYAGAHFRVHCLWEPGQPLIRGTIHGKSATVAVTRHGLTYRLTYRGRSGDLLILSQRAAELMARMPVKKAAIASQYLLSPMPGLLSQITVVAGDPVKKGQAIAVVEAMKMENVLRAERDGAVARVLAQAGDILAVDQPILEFQRAIPTNDGTGTHKNSKSCKGAP